MRRTHAHTARASPRAPATLELSIRGDELECDRIQLEHNLQQTDLSLHLSSAAGSNDDASVEYPRHNSAPSPHAEFRSFDRSGFDEDGPSQMQGWSYRTVDEDDAGHRYGESISTAAHHASAVTLSAGLGGRGARREVSLSGAEYDPERPLQDMIAGIGRKFPNAQAISFDPLVVDSTVELDRYLRSGRPTTPLRSPQSSSSSPSTPSSGRASPHVASRPKLSDQLHRASFSPKRPRNALPNTSVRNSRPNTPTQLRELAHASSRTPARAPLPTVARPTSPTPSPGPRPTRSRARTEDDEEQGSVDHAPTPRPRAKVRGHASAQSQPNIQLLPPTPTTANSTFARMARGLGREIASEKERAERAPAPGPARTEARAAKTTSTRPVERSALKTAANPTHRSVSFDVRAETIGLAAGGNASMKSHTSKVHLPDVTGLTSAVGSPFKGTRDYRKYRDGDGHREAEARLLTALNAVQSKLGDIEAENSISRRRVRELELELEACKQDVARERTRVLEKDELLLQQRHKLAREAQTESDHRYKQVVEEKKALEALIATLRTHLTRVTAELSSQKDLLEELKTLRESDARALKEKVAEVDHLREEVERLSGEVEVLRDVVEEGLKERRAAREDQSRLSGIDERSEESVEQREDDESGHDTLHRPPTPTVEDESVASLQSQSYRSRSRSPPLVEKPVRTERTTTASNDQAGPRSRPQFIDNNELDRISEELSERRSERSFSVSQAFSAAGVESPQQSGYMHGQGVPQHGRRSPVARADAPGGHHLRAPSPGPAARPSSRQNLMQEDLERRQASPRPTAPTPGHARRRARVDDESHADHTDPETPFPIIQGEHLERLFFSAPEHNAETCNACNRRRRANTATGAPQPTPTWLHDLKAKATGHGAGCEDENVPRRNGKEKAKGGDDRLPPQTVLARVLRDLEDDFTHYKSIYVELAEQYAVMDAASNVAKRNVLAGHLREVIDCLEQKGDQIASLYGLLTFKDKPIAESAVPNQAGRSDAQPKPRAPNPIASSSRDRRGHSPVFP